MVFSNYGTGTQNNNTGSGNQYNAINFLAEKKSSSFLADLRVTDPRDDKIRIEDTKGGLLRDSYNWILENEDFCQWREDTQRRLLWIKGDPGKGKTMLMCGTIDELRQSGEEPILFFCQAADERLNTATSVLRGLLYALFCQWPLLTESFLGKYENAGKQLFEDANAWNILRGMMMTTTLHESLEGVVLVIDALDECTSGLDQLLRVITSQPGVSDEPAMIASIVHALRAGYRLIDTAQMYGTESVVGKAIRESGVPREEITVVTKLWHSYHHMPGEALSKSLERLQLDYVDVYLMHFPCATTPDMKPLGIEGSPTFVETWKMMEGLVGPKCRAIGVSNFTQKTWATLLENASVLPAVNQIELHALNPCLNLVPYCQSKGIHVMGCGIMGGAYGPPFDQLLTNKIFVNLAKAKGCSVGVIHLSWVVQRGITAIFTSKSHSRLEDNLRLVTLNDDEMSIMNSAKDIIGERRMIDILRDKPEGKLTVVGASMVELGFEDDEGNFLT
ncbi:putative aldo keto reductase protein [Colletotrichum karsti]|uniref:Aldo keto reductase protein n=1 Tax=Colletotrichum karsti TaxID=1095194 RepID=A0A9P6IDK0_9PEZI|nr:putative aldo keto reductase protein [Colletotrichum karsti]KAF9881442.1 putative aldo keto reductase protein [Colletotrichum karsti]